MTTPLPIKTDVADRLQVRVYLDRTAMGAAAGADVIASMKDLLAKQDRIRMVFASAASQRELLRELSEAPDLDWSRVTVFHMDEYLGLPSDAPQQFSMFLEEHLFRHVRPGEVHLINSANDVEDECARYGTLIRAARIDIVCLGIGENGHLAFNDPHVADFSDRAVVKPVILDIASRQQQVHDGAFRTLDAVPKAALTLTIPTLMSGKRLYCVVPGTNKHAAVHAALYGPIERNCPASVLRCHPKCILYLDADSYGPDHLRL
jgi:glucosamine-6-phosphate deaminase